MTSIVSSVGMSQVSGKIEAAPGSAPTLTRGLTQAIEQAIGGLAVNATRTPISPIDQVAAFWGKVDRSGGHDACWPWMASRNPVSGYGVFHPSRTSGYPRTVSAHRFAAHLAGVIELEDATQHVDHECHNDTDCPPGPCAHRTCCNPGHFRRRSLAENVNRSHNSNAKKTHCPRGHEYTPENTRHQTRANTTIRKCIACEKQRDRERTRARKETN